jgi:hypothetical protein
LSPKLGSVQTGLVETASTAPQLPPKVLVRTRIRAVLEVWETHATLSEPSRGEIAREGWLADPLVSSWLGPLARVKVLLVGS